MAELINLRRARKQRGRDAAAATAAANRAKFGRTAGERDGAQSEADRAGRLLDGVRLADGTGLANGPKPPRD